jgi:hypothetical protein
MNTTRLVPEVVDFGDSPEIFVSGYAAVSRVSAGIVRETFYVTLEQPDGTLEKKVALRLLWDAGEWLTARRVNALVEAPEHKATPAEATTH